ncbi:MAG: hypothetical protein AABX77_02835 [Nanoarchaeota archaeon]
MNKKGLEDSLFTWIAAFLLIVFIMIIYLTLILIIFGEKKLIGDIEIVFEESQMNLELNSKFLYFLNSRILTDNKEDKIIHVIRNSLNPYFEIENDKGETFVGKYGLAALIEEGVALKNKMLADGFDESDWNEFINANSKFAQDEKIQEIRKNLDKICDKYILEIPQGVITEDIHKIRQVYGGEDGLYYTKPLIHKTNYKGQNIEIKLRIYKDCLKNQ